MFAIELVIVRSGNEPLVLDRMTLTASAVDDANRSAKTLLEKAQRARPHNPPNGYRIFDDHGTVVLRSWDGS